MPPIGFARPELLPLLAIVPLVVALVVLAYRARSRSLRTFGGASALVSRSGARWWLKSILLLVALGSLLVALAGPFVDLRARSARRLGVDLVVAIDVSQSMAVRDVEPDRLRAARHLAEELGHRMIGSRVALVLFAGQGTIRYPPTTDPRILGEVLDNSGRGVRLQQGSSLRSAVEASLGAFAPDLEPLRKRVIVVVSDGEMNVGDLPAADEFRDRAVRIFTVGVGTTAGGQIPTYDANNGKFTGYLRDAGGVPVTSRLTEDPLRRLAEAGGGRYVRYAGDDAAIEDLARELRTMEAIVPLDDAGVVPDERSVPFIALAVAAVLAESLLSSRRPMPTPRGAARSRGGGSSGAGGGATGRGATAPRWRILGVAIGSAALWAAACGDAALTNETANGRFAAGDYRGALEAYRDLQAASPASPELAVNAGNALHMLTEYARALPEYARGAEADRAYVRAIAQYDRGNTLFRMGRIEEARDAYKEALRLDPSDRDAKFNLELTLRLLTRRQQPPQSSPPPGQGQGPGGNSPGPGQGGGQTAAPSPGASAQPGDQQGGQQPGEGEPTDSRDPTGSPPPDLRPALEEFRRGLTIDEALRVLEALRGEQRGVGTLLEGPRSGPGQDY